MVYVVDIFYVLEAAALSKQVFSTKEASEYCHVSPETIRRWIRTKGLKAYNTGRNLRIKIKREDLETFIAKNNILIEG